MGAKPFLSVVTSAAAIMIAGAVSAADLSGAAAGYCLRLVPSALLDNPDKGAIRQQIEEWYAQALDVSDSNATIFSRKPVFTWASEAKVACGKAIGYLKTGEVEEETVSKCDCFHGRMVYFMR